MYTVYVMFGFERPACVLVSVTNCQLGIAQ